MLFLFLLFSSALAIIATTSRIYDNPIHLCYDNACSTYLLIDHNNHNVVSNHTSINIMKDHNETNITIQELDTNIIIRMYVSRDGVMIFQNNNIYYVSMYHDVIYLLKQNTDYVIISISFNETNIIFEIYDTEVIPLTIISIIISALMLSIY